MKFPGCVLQENPSVLIATIPGKWLLERTTPSWRISDPIKGFQRMVNEKRARQIAAAVLSQQRTFPNTIVLATDSRNLRQSDGFVQIPDAIKFLVVDGQHRLWAQHFSDFAADYGCVIHIGLKEPEMAALSGLDEQASE